MEISRPRGLEQGRRRPSARTALLVGCLAVAATTLVIASGEMAVAALAGLGAVAWWQAAGRQRREQRLSQERFRAVYAASPAGIVEVDLDVRVRRSNAAFGAMLGMRAEALIGHEIWEFFAGEVLADEREALSDLRAGRRHTYSTVRLLSSEGRGTLTVKLDWAAMSDDAGHPVQLACVVTDISAQARINQELQSAHQRVEVMWRDAPVGIIEGTPDGVITTVNGAFASVLGYEPHELIGRPIATLADPTFRNKITDGLARLQAGEGYVEERRYLSATGRSVPLLVSTAVLRDSDGYIDRLAAFVVDMSELHAEREQLKQAQRLGQLGSFTYDPGTDSFTPSAQLATVLGLEEEAERTDRWLTLVHPEDRPRMERTWQALLADGGSHQCEYRLQRPDGHVRFLRFAATRVVDRQGRLGLVQGTHQDMTDLVLAQREALEASHISTAVLAATPDCTFVTDLTNGEVVYAAPGKTILGLSAEELTERGPGAVEELVHPDDRHILTDALASIHVLDDGQVSQRRYRARHVDGSWRWLSTRATPFRRDGETGLTNQVLTVVRDISDVVLAEEQLQHTALHDPLTGLPNRALLRDRLDEALSRAHRVGSEMAILFCDLDGFKRVNDLAGHAAGDTVLIETAARLRSVLREHDTIARVGGDEFVILIEPWRRADRAGGTLGGTSDREIALHVAGRVAEALRQPFLIDEVEHVVTASVGITYAGLDDSERGDAILQDADAAMYRAKNSGRDRYEVFEDGLRADLAERGRVEQLLRHTLTLPLSVPTRKSIPSPRSAVGPLLTAAYQPIIDCGSGRLLGFEALARLQDGDGLPVRPDVFIDVAENTALIHELGRRMLEQACAQLAAWRAHQPGLEHVTMAVNISALQAQHASLIDDVRSALGRHELEPRDLVLELTESSLLQATPATITALKDLRADGTGIAIDDFGTGYASLRYLATLPVSAVKVDRSFTSGLPHDETSRKIVSAVVGLATDLNLECVVEGVETVEQQAALPPRVQVQGWLTGRPAFASDLDVGQLLHQAD